MSFGDSGGGPERDPSIADAVQEISERAVSLIQEEIELAKAEISEKFSKLLKGTVIVAVASVFIFWAIAIILFGFAYLVHFEGSWPADQFFWGFFIVGAILLIIAAIAGFVAYRFFKAGSPPVPTMAIDEAQRIRETVMPSSPDPAPRPGATSAAAAAEEPSSTKLPYDPPVYTETKFDDEPPVEEPPDDDDQDTAEQDKID
jgi:uncharacterized membrane protein YqjE